MDKGIGASLRRSWRIGTRRPTRYPCRCVSCGDRHVLRLQPDEYTRPRQCRHGCRAPLRIDWYRMAAEWHRKPCRCDGYSFPHARGRGYCMHNPELSADMLRERYEAGAYA